LLDTLTTNGTNASNDVLLSAANSATKKAALRRGRKSEKRFENMIAELGNGCFADVRKATNDEDQRGIDYILTLTDGRIININVKSSFVSVRDFLHKHPDGDIIPINVGPKTKLKHFRSQIFRIINLK